MSEIRGNVGAALDAVHNSVLEVVLNIGMDVYGPVDEDTGLRIAGALGLAIKGVQDQASLGVFSGQEKAGT